MIPQPWIKQACARLGPFPSRYISFDIETTGLSPNQDLLAQTAFLLFEDDKLVREETFWVDHITPMLPVHRLQLEAKLADTRQKIESKPSRFNVKYAVSVETMRSGVSVSRAKDSIRSWLNFSRGERIPMVGHNPKFDVRFMTAFIGDFQAFDDIQMIDTDVVERAVQAMPQQIQHRDWFEFCKNCSGLGGNKFKSNLSGWCADKYGWHERQMVDMNQAHDAWCDAWLSHLLLQEYKAAATYGS